VAIDPSGIKLIVRVAVVPAPKLVETSESGWDAV
jgi:hypothetical protein